MPYRDEIKKYNEERNAALLGTLEEFTKFFHKYAPNGASARPDVIELTYHKSRTAVVTLPMEERTKSKRWLKAHHSFAHDDGDVPD